MGGHHSSPDSGPFVCPNCGRSYKHQRNLTSHINLDCGKEAAFPCPLCPFRGKRRNKLKLHMAMKHSGVNPIPSLDDVSNLLSFDMYVCGECNRTYKHKGNLTQHQRYECNKLPQFACEHCSYRCKIKRSLKRHVLTVHGPSWLNMTCFFEKPHKCQSCGRRYKNKCHLTQHRRNECGKLPKFACPHCCYKCKQKQSMKRHIYTVHADIVSLSFDSALCLLADVLMFKGQSVFECPNCGKRYRHQSSLCYHKRECGKEATLQCAYCPYKAKQNRSLKIHVMMRHVNKST
ncbi:hypothetical protein J6590_014756 [Homalodisca vitripennis]|nr:hypothetical protein J6590_014756 [Homalodisca vitripennis]